MTIWDVCKSTSTLNIEIFAATHLVTLPQHKLPIRAVIEPGISSDEKLYQPALLFAQTALLLNSIQTIICHSVNHLTFDSNHTTEPEFLQGGNGSQCATVNLGLGNVEAGGLRDESEGLSQLLMSPQPSPPSPCCPRSPRASLALPHTLSNTSLLMSCKVLHFQTFQRLGLSLVSTRQQVGSSWGAATQRVVRAPLTDTLPRHWLECRRETPQLCN